MHTIQRLFLAFLLMAMLVGCTGRSDAPTATPTMPPRPTVPIKPTSTPSSQALPATKGVFPVDLLTEDGIPIKGDYYRPIASNVPGIILIHGSARTRSDWQLLAWQLMEQGIATLAIDLRGFGESGGMPDDPNKLEDIAAAVAFLTAQAQVDPTFILLIGEDDGAWWALDYAAKHEDISEVALISPGIRYDKKLLRQVMSAYGDRPLFIAVSDNPAIKDNHALKTAKLLHQLAKGPSTLEISEDNGVGIGLLMRENGLASSLLFWLGLEADQSSGDQG